MYQASISVRGLVEFVYRSGDLDLRFQGKSKMADGIKVHQKIQRSQGIAYMPEVTLQRTHRFIDESSDEPVELSVNGRADGILTLDSSVVIDEIKGVSGFLDDIDENTYPLHWAQAKMYGAIYCSQHSLGEIGIQLTYAAFDTDEVKRIKKQYTSHELEQFYLNTVKLYEKWVCSKKNWIKLRNTSVEQLKFPFDDYRKGQREMAVSVFNSVKNGKTTFIEAPTGIGKTVSTLFPTIKAMAEGYHDKIFYLAAKSVTKSVAEETMHLLGRQTLRLKSLTLTAKNKICLNEEVTCYPAKCPYAKGHFDRCNEAIWFAINEEDDALTRELVEHISKQFRVCPYELSLDIALFSDLIICDYNYAFDPRVYLRRFFDVPTEKYTLLVDEAHNLVDRSRDMYSAELNKNKVTVLKKKVQAADGKLKTYIEGVNKIVLDARRSCDEEGVYVHEEAIESIDFQLRKRATQIEKWLVDYPKSECYEEVLDLYFDILSYLRISELYDDGFLFYIINGKNSDTIIKLYCINPSNQIQKFINTSISTVFFSATLSPISYYISLLSHQVENPVNTLKLSSPFPPKNQMTLLAKDISVKYKNRDDAILPICDYIYKMASSKVGNYMVFLPSYKYLETISEAFMAIYDRQFDFVLQEKAMTEESRRLFLEAYEKKDQIKNQSLIGFVVLGGIFSEGIDLSGDRLIGVTIVGVGLPGINFEKDLTKVYFDENNKNGFEYAYQYPGINKVLQAAGRVIRSMDDKGVVVLLDNRFLQKYYYQLLPKSWHKHIVTQQETEKKLKQFWEEDLL